MAPTTYVAPADWQAILASALGATETGEDEADGHALSAAADDERRDDD